MSGHSIDYEARQAARRAMEIPGQIREAEAAFLYRQARRKGHMVEIGCLFGRSTSALVCAAAVYEAHLTSIDPFFKTPNTKTDASPEVWRENLKNLELTPPDLLHMTSHEAAKLYKSEISFLFIDGGHNYETVRQDIEDWTPMVRETGVVVFHDMFAPHIDGVTRAVSEWWLSEYENKEMKWKLEGMVNFMIAFRRLG